VLVEGTLTADPKTGGPRVYTRQDGAAASGFEIRANQIKFLSPKSEGGVEGGGAPDVAPVEAGGDDSDPIPF
ncbi:MAG TPA: hypothetical protein VGK81_10080, partial [Anaerolineae bacterium]